MVEAEDEAGQSVRPDVPRKQHPHLPLQRQAAAEPAQAQKQTVGHGHSLPQLSPGVITEWDEGSVQHPKLAVCSGKVVMVYQDAVQGGKEHEYTVKVDVLDDEKGTWRGASRLPEELRRGVSFSPEAINCGGDELVVVDIRSYYALGYNLVTGAWYPLGDSKNRAIDILPMSLSY